MDRVSGAFKRWTQLATFATSVSAGTVYNLKLVASGSASVHLEVWLNGTKVISFDDASSSRITSGPPGIENYDTNVKYDSFSVQPVSAPPPTLFSDDFNRTTGLGTNWQVWDGGYTTDGANAVSVLALRPPEVVADAELAADDRRLLLAEPEPAALARLAHDGEVACRAEEDDRLLVQSEPTLPPGPRISRTA